MDASTFEAQLRADGFQEIETRLMDARPANGEHGHHFDVRGLVLEGSFIVTSDAVEHVYKTGDVFEVPAGRLHCEAVGQEGAKILVGRRT